jgi:DNA-binding PadR family transcriptional regulator
MLRYAILTLLADSPRTGYDLSKDFDASLTYVWPAGQNQIYPELRRLVDDGLITGEEVPPSHGRSKRVYQLTPAGRDALAAWIVTTSHATAPRDDFQLRVINFGRMPRERALELIEHQKEILTRRLANFEDIAAALDTLSDAGATPDVQLGWRLAIEAGLRTHRAYIEWCDWAKQQLPG